MKLTNATKLGLPIVLITTFLGLGGWTSLAICAMVGIHSGATLAERKGK